LALECDLVLVVGSPNSSNSNRLRELAERCGVKSYLVDGPEDLDQKWFNQVHTVGITAGASAPEVLVKDIFDGLMAMGASAPQELSGREENISFSLPRELR